MQQQSTSGSMSKSLGSAGCGLIPFGSLFAGMGLLLFIGILKSNKPDPNAWVGLFVCLLFMGVGSAIIFGGVAATAPGDISRRGSRNFPMSPGDGTRSG